MTDNERVFGTASLSDITDWSAVLVASTEAQARLTGEVAVLRTQLTRALDALDSCYYLLNVVVKSIDPHVFDHFRDQDLNDLESVRAVLAAHDQEAE